MGGGGGGWAASLQHPAACIYRYHTEMTHLVIMHPERFQVIGLCARSDFNVINLFHSLQLQLDGRLTDGNLSPHAN